MADITINDRARVMQKAYTHYQGNPTRPLVEQPGQPSDNVIVSLARLIVDKGASFLFGEPVESQVDLPEGSKTREQAELNECWRRNQRQLTLLKFATNGGIYGHGFLRLIPARPDQQYPRIVVLDSSIVEVVANPDDVDDPWKFIITPVAPPLSDEDADDTELPRRTVIASPSGQAGYRVLEAGWFIEDQQFSNGQWQRVMVQEWPWIFCPIVQCQNVPRPNSFWGESDLPDDVLHILDAINRVASHMNKTLRLFAHPKVFSVGMGTRNIDMSIDSIIHLPSEAADLRILQMQSDLSGSLNYLNWLLNQLAMIVRIPLVAMGLPDTLGTLSGVSLQIRYQPLLEKTKAKRQTYGHALIEADRCLMAMMGLGETTLTTLVWPEVLPEDTLQERQVAVLDDSLGVVSKETLSRKMGYNWDAERAKVEAEHEADVAAGITPQPGAAAVVPPPEPMKPPIPDVARGKRST